MHTDQLNFSELIKKRYSVRSYKSEMIKKEDILKILEAGRVAPSAVNIQPWYFMVITDPAIREKLNQAYAREWFYRAPVVIVVCGDHDKAWHRKSDGKDHTDIDIAIAADHMILQATELGIGSCWVCNFDAEICASALELPAGIEPVVMIPLGYIDQINISDKIRKSLDDIVRWEKF